ncbi:hypothetical protein Pfl04_03950 [Planosporangium flavigriseum]|uniref:Uncharacterized protein n=1 Tax=Planosporangium flavigriseum TaxID=373681 RepID=A0A8J3LQQ6_9ACTN|nr:hypothetical protein Pfl04_03950 [Planosporangium flavigriseum]
MSVASALLVAAAVVALLPLVSLVYDLVHFDDVLRRAAERTAASPQEISQERSANRIVSAVAIAVVLLTSAALFIPALWLRRGSPVARAFSCVAGSGAALCCCGGYGLSLAAQSSPSTSELQAEVTRLSARETPAWVPLMSLPAVLVVPLAITAVVLLLLPPSNRFFRQPPPAPPPQPYGGYYAYPANHPEEPTNPPDSPDHPPGNPPRE